MKRRDLLKAASAAAIAATWPGWLRSAFAAEQCRTGPDVAGAKVAVAFRRAQRTGRLLLVFVIPSQSRERWPRAAAFGEVLNHGSDEVLAALAQVEIVCATMDDVRRIIPDVGDGEPTMLLIAPTVPATGRQIEVNVQLEAQRIPPRVVTAENAWQQEAVAVDARIQAMSEAILGGLRADPDGARHRADAVLASLSAAERKQLQAIARGKANGPAELVDSAGAALAVEPTAGVVALLAASSRRRFVTRRVPGSKWARSGGCSEEIEGEADDGAMVMCGMGHVPEKSQRYLHWETKESASEGE